MQTTSSFANLGLSDPLLRALEAEGYATPTPIQQLAIPHVLGGRDLFGCSQTGTGKTAAFALPLIERMRARPASRAARRCRTLVLAPTRELAGQIHESFVAYGRHAGVRAAVVYGGVSQRPQADALARGLDVLVATPGRLLDLVGQRLADLQGVEFLVLDEADRMLDMGFIRDIRKIVGMLPKTRQTLFFSATLPAEVRSLADSMLRDPLELTVTPQATPAETVSQSVFFVPQREKRAKLVELLRDEPMARVIVFTRTKHGADRLQRDLDKAGFNAAAIHGNKSQNQRERALDAFKSNRPPVLIATDIAARGIDVDGVSHVINFELPHEPETYVHRIGRTGRAGASGLAVSFAGGGNDARLVADIEKLIKKKIDIEALEFEDDRPRGRFNDGRRAWREGDDAPREARRESDDGYRERRAPRPSAAPRDPFFDQPYEAAAPADGEASKPAWETASRQATPVRGISANIKTRRKVAALFKAQQPQ
jgi:superfamily II DNA/RNA helicase